MWLQLAPRTLAVYCKWYSRWEIFLLVRVLDFATRTSHKPAKCFVWEKSGTTLRLEFLTANCKIVSVRKTWFIPADRCHKNLTQASKIVAVRKSWHRLVDPCPQYPHRDLPKFLCEKIVPLTFMIFAWGKRCSYLLTLCHKTSQKSGHQPGTRHTPAWFWPRSNRYWSENRYSI